MRNRLLLLSAAVLLSACADDPHTTAPASRSSSSSRSAVGDVMPSGQGIRVPDAKPTGQVGFTQITIVWSAIVHVAPGEISQTIATCPAGSTAVGGGYNITGYVATTTPPLTLFIGLDGQNGWKARFSNEPVGAGGFNYLAAVYCAS